MRFRHLPAAALALSLVGAAHAAPPPRAAVKAWVDANQRAVLSDFMAFAAMPNVATTLPDVEKNAAYLRAELEKRGFTTRLLSAAPGTPPSVFAERRTPGARRTMLFYAHYDGQPIAQKGWILKPFAPEVRTALPDAKPVDWRTAPALDPEWRVFGRGTGDDKLSIQAMLSALDALKAAGAKPSVNIKLLYEGEEEQGSPHFRTIVEQNAALLKADALIMGDGPMHQSGRQIVTFGNRGIVGFTVTVYGPTKPLHDGHYGSFAPSPTVMLAHLIARMRDEDGTIRIPGVLAGVAPVTAADRAAIAAMPANEADVRRALGLGRSIGPARLPEGYLAPTLNVRAIHAGDDGPNAANAIATEGHASFDLRLAAGQKPEAVKRAVEDWLKAEGWTVVTATPDAAFRGAHAKVLKLGWDEGASEAARTPLDLPAAQAVVGSIARTVGYQPILSPTSGGSSGIADATKALGTPMVGVSIANYDDNQHAENENIRLGNLWEGIAVYAGLLSDLDW
jgi:acetylornithine deacetylase/succinyl-diaminopimelate desuccinylase-like protein